MNEPRPQGNDVKVKMGNARMSDIKSLTGAIDAYKNAGKIAGGNSNGDEVSFSGLVSNAAQDSISTLRSTEQITSASLVDSVNLEDLATAVTNAETTLKTVVAVRDRIISAYQDIIKMPI